MKFYLIVPTLRGVIISAVIMAMHRFENPISINVEPQRTLSGHLFTM